MSIFCFPFSTSIILFTPFQDDFTLILGIVMMMVKYPRDGSSSLTTTKNKMLQILYKGC